MRMRAAIRCLTPLMLVVLAAGCDAEPRNEGGGPKQAAKPKPKPKPREDGSIVGKRTQDIRSADAEVKKDATVVQPRITAKDPITLQGNAYVTAIGQTSILNIKHAMDLYYAEKERYPKDLDEFMTDIIKANGIALPRLPDYQEYGYDANEHKLVILEYPDRKNAPPPQ